MAPPPQLWSVIGPQLSRGPDPVEVLIQLVCAQVTGPGQQNRGESSFQQNGPVWCHCPLHITQLPPAGLVAEVISRTGFTVQVPTLCSGSVELQQVDPEDQLSLAQPPVGGASVGAASEQLRGFGKCLFINASFIDILLI